MNLVRRQRELRVDFFRGLALWWIFVDHISGNWLSYTTLHNFALCDATEVFVLLAGYSAGLAYGRSMMRNGYLFAAADAVRRAWTLYVAHIFLFVVFSAQVTWSAAALNRADYLDEINLDALGSNPYEALLRALALNFQPAFLDILPMYIALLLIFALLMPLLRWPAVLGAVSFTIYAVARVFMLNLPTWHGDGWYFNPLTWQLLFMLGAILAIAPGEPPLPRRLLDAMSAAMLVVGLVVMYVIWERPGLTAALPIRLARTLFSIDKEGLHPYRLASILALAWLTTRLVPPKAAWLNRNFAWPFEVCGQHSLPVFCSSIFLSFVGRLALEQDDRWAMQIAVNVGGAAALVAVGALAAWYREKGAAAAARDRAAAAPSPGLAAFPATAPLGTGVLSEAARTDTGLPQG